MATITRAAPPLEAGDFLTREEFLERWEAHEEIKKAELLRGVVYMGSPVGNEHSETDGNVGGWVFAYKLATPGCTFGHNASCLLEDDVPQPDLHLRILPECGGKSWIEDDRLMGAPELIVEVCRSSASYDLHVKYDIYEQAGVQEYVTILLYEREVRWHLLKRKRYVPLPADARGIFQSRVFPGLWLDAKALLDGNGKRLIARLQEGLATAEHKEFVRKMEALAK